MKFSAKAIAFALAFALLSSIAVADEYIGVAVNGHHLFLDQSPVMRDGRVLVPLRGIFEALGAEVKWVSETRTVHAETNPPDAADADPNIANIIIDLPIDAPIARINETDVPVAVPATMINGKTMVPLRFVGEAVGAKVKWDGEKRIVLVAGPGFESTLDDTEDPEFTPSTWGLSTGLARIKVGNQAGLLKVMDESDTVTRYLRVIDDYSQAQVTPEQRQMVLDSLNLTPNELRCLAVRLINNYVAERKHRLQLVALLGMIAANNDNSIDLATSERIQTFLVSKLIGGDDKLGQEQQTVLKRQCLVALALMTTNTPQAIDAVVRFYEKEQANLWVTSPMPLYFRLHADEIKALPNFDTIYSRISSVPSLYTAKITEYLNI